MADIWGLAGSAIFSALTGNANLSALVAGRIYDSEAPSATTYPLVIMQFTGGGDTYESPRRNQDVVWRVECVGKILSDARLGAGYIDDALQDQTLTVPGWSNWRCEAINNFAQIDTIEGQQYWRRGQFYRIEFDQNG